MTKSPNRRLVGLKLGLWLFIAGLSCGGVVLGQTFSGEVTGSVVDPSGRAVPKAGVTLENTDTHAVRQATTNGQGIYVFAQLLPGHYQLTVEANGFKNASRSGIILLADQTIALNITLQLGQVSQTVSVRANPVRIESQNASESATLDSTQVQNLPVATLNPLFLVHGTAGVVSVRTGIGETAQDDQNSNRFALNGGRDDSSLVLLDGVPESGGDWGGLIIAPSLDSVQEEQVIRSSYEAQFGRSSGGVFSMVTKSGTNRFHGDAFEYLTNNAFDANLWANNRAGKPLAALHENQFGGSLGGPISRSKRLYFFGDYQGLREISPSNDTTTVPTMAQRNGDFSQTFNPNGSLSVIYNPFSTTPNPNGSGFIRTPFPGNMIPSSMFDPIGAKILSLFPMPNAAGNPLTGGNNFVSAKSQSYTTNLYDWRIDWAQSARYSLFARMSQSWENTIPAVFFGNHVDSNFGGPNPRYQIVLGNTFVVNPTMVINLLLGTGTWREEQISPSQGLNATAIGLPAALASQFQAPTIPQFTFENYAQLGNERYLNDARQDNELEVNATKAKGTHTIGFGLQIESQRIDDLDVDSASFGFNRGMTSGPVAATDSSISGNAIASLLLGTGSGGSAPINPTPATNGMYYAVYAQDSWKVTRRLTISPGLRYEIQKPWTERYNRQSYFNFTTPNPLGQQVGLPLLGGLEFTTASNRYPWSTDWHTLAPRIGLAYEITPKLVARAGYGIFYLPAATGTSTTGFSESTPWLSSVGNSGIQPLDLISNPFPQGLLAPPGRSQGLETLVGQGIGTLEYNRPVGYMQNYSLDFQYQLTPTSVLEVGYSASQGRDLPWGFGLQINQLPAQDLAMGQALNQQVANPFRGLLPGSSLDGATIPAYQLLRPYPEFTGVSLPNDTTGATSSFNSLIVQFTHRFSQGLDVVSGYQWSKAIDDASETQGWELGDTYQNYDDLNASRSISGHDVPQSWVTSLVYDLPVGRGRKFGSTMNKAEDAVVGGWNVSAVVNLASGLPLHFSTSNSLAVYGFPVLLPNVLNIKQVVTGPQTPSHWFNTQDFTNPAAFTLGDAPRWFGNLRNGPTRNADIAILKNFNFSERYHLQFRAEFFNAPNYPQFASPNTTVGSPTFGEVTGTYNTNPREIQFALRFSF